MPSAREGFTVTAILAAQQLPLFSELQPGPALPSGQERGHMCGFSVGLALPGKGLPAPWSSQIDSLLFIFILLF